MTEDVHVRAEDTEVGELIRRSIDVVQVNDFIYMATGLANMYVVTTPAGHVVVDTGLEIQSEAQHEKLKAVIPEAPITHIIFPQAQQDDIGGFDLWHEEETKVIMPRESYERMKWRFTVTPGLLRRFSVLYPWAASKVPPPDGPHNYPVIQPDIIVENNETYEFEVGGLKLQVFWLPGAEGLNSGGVWLPEHKILLCGGGFTGPIWRMWPNFGTLRGDRYRLVLPYIDSLNKALKLEPEMLLQGQVLPIKGKEEIRTGLTLIRDAIIYLHNAVIRGLNHGMDVYQMMREITVPPEFQSLNQEHGKIEWIIRSIVDYYGFWFQYRSTTELYPIPVYDLYPDIAEMAGIEALVQRATKRVGSGQLVEALHFAEMALAGEPGNEDALHIQLDAFKALLNNARTTTGNFQEIAWLEAEINKTEDQLSQ